MDLGNRCHQIPHRFVLYGILGDSTESCEASEFFHFGENIFTVRYFDFSDRNFLSVVSLKEILNEKKLSVEKKILCFPVTKSLMEIL